MLSNQVSWIQVLYIIGLKCSFVKKMTIPVYSDPKCDGNCLSEIVCHTIFKLSASKDYDSIKDEKQGEKLYEDDR